MAGISLSPRRALAYPGTRLTFVDESSVAYCFGSTVRITHLLPDKVMDIICQHAIDVAPPKVQVTFVIILSNISPENMLLCPTSGWISRTNLKVNA